MSQGEILVGLLILWLTTLLICLLVSLRLLRQISGRGDEQRRRDVVDMSIHLDMVAWMRELYTVSDDPTQAVMMPEYLRARGRDLVSRHRRWSSTAR